MKVQIYVCPTDGCTNYYGASGMPELHKEHTGPKTEDRHQVPVEQSRVGEPGMRHSRAECPDCRQRGIYVDRELLTVVIAGRIPVMGDLPMDERSLA